MEIDKLADEYQQQAGILFAKVDGLRPLLRVYTGEDLFQLQRKIAAYYDMATDCRRISVILREYYD